MLEIVYRDAHFVAINKPNGLFVHPTDLDCTAASAMPLLRDLAIANLKFGEHRCL